MLEWLQCCPKLACTPQAIWVTPIPPLTLYLFNFYNSHKDPLHNLTTQNILSSKLKVDIQPYPDSFSGNLCSLQKIQGMYNWFLDHIKLPTWDKFIYIRLWYWTSHVFYLQYIFKQFKKLRNKHIWLGQQMPVGIFLGSI